jgi:hypothetical protein
MILHGILSLFLLLQGSGAIQGAVTDSSTGQAVVGAQVLLVKLPAMGPRGRSQTETLLRIPPQTSDTAGRFNFQNLPLGDYILRVVAEGYGDGSFVGRTTQSNGMVLAITEKERNLDISFRLIRGSAISGRIVGVNNEPLGNMEVSLFQTRQEPGGRTVHNQAMYTATNDRGEYRLFPVSPGRYKLSASAPTHPIRNVPGGIGPINNPKNKHPRLFYPGTPDPVAAAVIDVPTGGEIAGMDFRMSEQPTFRIKGRVIDTITGQLPATVGMSITERNSNLNLGGFSTAQVIDRRDGTFELLHVAPGSYIIRAQIPTTQRGTTPRSPGSAEGAAAAVDIVNRDVEGVVVAFGPPLRLTGRVRMENGGTPPAGRANLVLRPPTPMTMSGGTHTLQWNSDGSFRVEGVEPGEYLVSFAPQQAGLTVREMRSGSTNLLTQPVLLIDPRTDEIVVTLSTSGGR